MRKKKKRRRNEEDGAGGGTQRSEALFTLDRLSFNCQTERDELAVGAAGQDIFLTYWMGATAERLLWRHDIHAAAARIDGQREGGTQGGRAEKTTATNKQTNTKAQSG